MAYVKIDGNINIDCSQTHLRITQHRTEPTPIRDNGYQDPNPAYAPAATLHGKTNQIEDAQQTPSAAIPASATARAALNVPRGLNVESTFCQRDNENRITCLMVVTNFEVPIEFGIQFGNCCVIYDERGNKARIVHAMIGDVQSAFTEYTGYIRGVLAHNIKTQMVFMFESMPAGMTQVKEMQLKLKIAGRFHPLTFQNIPIL